MDRTDPGNGPQRTTPARERRPEPERTPERERTSERERPQRAPTGPRARRDEGRRSEQEAEYDDLRGIGADAGASLRGLAGRGPSQVGVSGAMRARDVSRPTERHVKEAEALDLEIASRRTRPRQRRTRD